MNDNLTAGGIPDRPANSPTGDAFDYLAEQVSTIQDLVFVLGERIDSVLGPILDSDEQIVSNRVPLVERSSLVTHIREEGHRLEQVNEKLRNIIDRVEL